MSRIPALFLNSPRAQCSIHESGRMVFAAIQDSDVFDWDYADLHQGYHPEKKRYGCVVFNYHPGTMPWLDTETVRRIGCLKGTMILETLPESVFPLCPRDVFDVHLAIDPTAIEEPGRVYAMPRPLEEILAPVAPSAAELRHPVIGTFGFGTPGKGFERVVDAVNREFDSATIRVNIPEADFADGAMLAMHRMPYAQYLVELMRRVAKPGVVIEATRVFHSPPDLIRWCRSNTINVFLYDRMQPGLSATTDQAVASGRPLLVSDNPTFRHLHRYQPAYPEWTIRDALERGVESVGRIQSDWNQAAFRKRFESALLDRAGQAGASPRRRAIVQFGIKSGRSQWEKIGRELARFRRRIGRAIGTRPPAVEQPKPEAPAPLGPPSMHDPLHAAGVDVLFVNHPQARCGVHQYGHNVAAQIRRIEGIRLHYRTVESAAGFFDAYRRVQPAAVIFNHYPATMPWLTPDVAAEVAATKLGILHEMTQAVVEGLDGTLFDRHVVPDPTVRTRRADVFLAPRLLPDFCNYVPEPAGPVFGSFGFGFHNKRFEDCIDRIQAEYDEARIVFRMPFNDVVDPDGVYHARATAERCMARVQKPGIHLEIDHGFLEAADLLAFLGGNTANIFLYDESLHVGISSVLEYAIAARRPLVINRCGMFRHVWSAVPGICVEDHSVRSIVERGIAPLVPLYNEWSAAMFRRRWRDFLHTVAMAPPGAAGGRGLRHVA